MLKQWLAIACLAAWATFGMSAVAMAQGMSVPWTALAEVRIQAPEVTGEVLLAADAIETLVPIDTDGDVEFSREELDRVRPRLMGYINAHFRIMWEGRIQRLVVTDLDSQRRGTTSRRYLRATFRVRDYPPGMEVVILSDLLDELSPPPGCLALIDYQGRREVFAFGREHYYTTHPSRWVVEDDGIYRPPSERGRITPSPTTPIEMLYAMPEGAFYLYCLMPDRYTPRPIADDALEVTISDANDAKLHRARLTLKAMPLPADPEGRSSRFRAEASDEWMSVESFKADLTMGDGQDRRRVIFDFPAVATGATSALPRRYACPALCLAVESRRAGERCPRCGARLIEARGDHVPGVGVMGLHGGPVTTLNAKGELAELVLVAPNELRLYRTTTGLEVRPIGDLAGVVMPFRSDRAEGPPPRLPFKRDPAGQYLSAALSGPMFLPGGVRCILTEGDSAEPILLEFQVWEKLRSPPEIEAQPVTSQPADEAESIR